MNFFLTIALFIAAVFSASATPVTIDLYSGGDSTSTCSYGAVSYCEFSGWWNYGNSTTDTYANNGNYFDNYLSTTVFWLNAGKNVTTVDGFGDYRGVNMWGSDWGAGNQINNSTYYTNRTNTWMFADTTGYSSQGGDSSFETLVDKVFTAYYFTCQLGLCTQTSVWNSNADKTTQLYGWWQTFQFGQSAGGGNWQDAFREEFPDSQLYVTQFYQDGRGPVPTVPPTDTPETGTLSMIGTGLIAAGFYRRTRG